MKKIFRFVIIILISVFSFTIINSYSIKVNAEEDKVTIKNYLGQTVCYYGTSTPILVPTTYNEKVSEFRGTWVSFFAGDISGYSSQTQMMTQLNNVLDNLEYFNMNAVVFHIRTHNDVYYDSDLAPRNDDIMSCNFEEWDYLEWFINECHKRGIEFHAWLNPYRITSTKTTEEYIKAKYVDYPNNPASNMDNVLLGSDGAILDPGRPEVVSYLNEVVMEIVNKYDVDAIHFDDYFYISDVDDSKTRSLYNTKKYNTEDFRRASVDNLIQTLDKSLDEYNRKNNKSVQLGISPSGVYRNGSYVSPNNYKYNDKGVLTYPVYSGSAGYSHFDYPLYSDTKKWVDQGWIDYIIPQAYNAIDLIISSHAAVMEWWDGVVKNSKCKLYAGVGFYKIGVEVGGWQSNEDELLMQLRFDNHLENVDGICIYQYKSLVRNKEKNVLKKLVKEYWTNTPLNPTTLEYANQYDMSSVSNLKLYKANNIISITWDKMDNVNRYLVLKYKDKLDINNIDLYDDIVGYNELGEMVVYTDLNYDNTEYNYAVYPITRSNTLGKVNIINTNNNSEVNIKVGDINIVTGTPSFLGAQVSIVFNKPEIFIGDIGSYTVIGSYDSDFKDSFVLIENKEYVDSNIQRFYTDKDGRTMYVKTICTNCFGVFESNVCKVYYEDDCKGMMDYIFKEYKKTLSNMFSE